MNPFAFRILGARSSISKNLQLDHLTYNNLGWKVQRIRHFSSTNEIDINEMEKRIRESFVRQEFMTFIGAKLTRVKPGFVEIQLPYHKNLTQQHGFFHGDEGILGTLADNCGGYSSYSLIPPEDTVLTVEYKINIISPAEGELLIARGEVIKPGRTLLISRSDVFAVKNGIEKLCAISQQTIMRIAGKKDSPGMASNSK